MELKIDSEKVLAAAKVCPEARRVLKAIFPELLEDKYYKCGQKFLDVDAMEEAGITEYQPATLATDHPEYLYLLCHSHEPRSYCLINVKTGYNKVRAQSYRRNTYGISIPPEHLKGLREVS